MTEKEEICMREKDEIFLRRAIEMAKIARDKGQEPFGAVLVKNDEIVCEAINKIYELSDPTAHAEITLIKEFCQKNNLMKLTGHANLSGYSLYCSTEPCMMCSGAILLVKISKVIYSVSQERLHKISGGSKKMDCKSLLNSHPEIDIIGPELLEEGLLVFKDYSFKQEKKIMP
jgi:guanine deaminase